MELTTSLETFFKDEVDRALREQGFSAETLTEHYLVQLLAAYAGKAIDDAPLGIKMLEAMEAAPMARRSQLREVGDTSLYVSGFWSDSFTDKLYDVDYYIGLGGSAYAQLSRGAVRVHADPFGDVFGELAAHFARFVEVLAVVSRRTTHLGGNQDILRLVGRWQRTKSRWAARRLAALGVLPPSDGRPQ